MITTTNMITTTRKTMTTDTHNFPSLLVAFRLADSFLPLGSHTASYGIEQYLNEDRVETTTDLTSLIADYLQSMIGPTETVALACAHRTVKDDVPSELLTIDQRLHATILPAEFRKSSVTIGDRLLSVFATTDSLPPVLAEFYRRVDDEKTHGHFPVVLGALTAASGIDRQIACQLHGYMFVTDVLGAAQRIGRFGHTAIQQTLVDLFPDIAGLKQYAGAELSDLHSFAPMAEIMGMRHENAERRLFMS